jgi:hypothetical protein
MYARVATFEGGDPSRADEVIGAIRNMIESQWDSPPEGLETVKETWVLIDRRAGSGIGVNVFESEEDMRRADEALNAMTPPTEAGGQRSGVAHYEVALHKER